MENTPPGPICTPRPEGNLEYAFFGIIFLPQKLRLRNFFDKSHVCHAIYDLAQENYKYEFRRNRCSFYRKWFILSLLYLTVMFADCIKGDVLKVHNISRGKNLNTFVK